MRWLLPLLLSLASPASAREVFVHFLCHTSDQAVAFIQGESTEGCQALTNVEMTQRVAELLEITEILLIEDYVVEIGRVQIGNTIGYSAGKLGGLFS